MIYKKYILFAVYIMGFLTPFILIVLLTIVGVRFPKSKAQRAISEWNIIECNETLLHVGIPSEPNVWFAVGIDRDFKTKYIKDIDITITDKGQTLAFFRYLKNGKYGCQMVSYGFADKGIVWRDLNFDSRFDERIDYKDKNISINISDMWVHGTGKDDMKTERGVFRFDPNDGEWKEILVNPIHDN